MRVWILCHGERCVALMRPDRRAVCTCCGKIVNVVLPG